MGADFRTPHYDRLFDEVVPSVRPKSLQMGNSSRPSMMRSVELGSNENGGQSGRINGLFEVNVLMDHVQQLNLNLRVVGTNEVMVITLVYAKCTQRERTKLWENLANNIQHPWLVGGDFNSIVADSEKYGGLLLTLNEIQDFRACIQNCNIEDLGFKGSNYTWWNGHSGEDFIFKRLDRCLGDNEPIQKPFRILNLWVKHESFLDKVKGFLSVDFVANPFTLFHHKLKTVKACLTQWSKETYGNIYKDIETLEDIIKVHEQQFEMQPTSINRGSFHRVQAKLTKILHLEEELWKQKAGTQWFQDGDRNTKFFHAYVKGRRKRLQVNRTQDQQGNWLDEKEEIVENALRF
ncbi:uncharacterized protein LOC132607911 [Lycium barbarum]|uniref:uncharacterized protein LOC132607911 n=1 Tax=Lycium barbarum TaxID=112863 RepID=UPI00293E13E1|nr:uncharacterized protein LOC132607911 [Lycium barbarum]